MGKIRYITANYSYSPNQIIMTEERQLQYFDLIDQLLKCPNGQEPEILEAQPELIDTGFVETMLQVAASFAHSGNQDGAQFLFFVARELAKQLGLYQVPNSDTPHKE